MSPTRFERSWENTAAHCTSYVGMNSPAWYEATVSTAGAQSPVLACRHFSTVAVALLLPGGISPTCDIAYRASAAFCGVDGGCGACISAWLNLAERPGGVRIEVLGRGPHPLVSRWTRCVGRFPQAHEGHVQDLGASRIHVTPSTGSRRSCWRQPGRAVDPVVRRRRSKRPMRCLPGYLAQFEDTVKRRKQER